MPQKIKRIFKTNRQKRYSLLRSCGFLRIESVELSKVPLKVPYMDALIKGRFKEFREAFKQGWTLKRWETAIKQRYISNNWLTEKRNYYDAWAMLRDFEHTYRVRHPDYESPWEKRRKDFVGFVRQVEKTVTMLPTTAKEMSPEVKAMFLKQQSEIDKQFAHIEEQRKKRESK